MVFQAKLTALRKQHGWSQEELGNQVGVSRQTVSKWELGETTPELEKLIQLAEIFGLSIDELTGYEKQASVKEYRNSQSGADLYAWHYEYKSKKTVWGIPLVHIHIGRGLCKAKGIIAVGNIAKGVVAIGAVSLGVVSIGAVSVGLLAFGALTLALLLAAGAISVGAVAFGGVAVGLLAVGGYAVGQYSLGGFAVASRVALGGVAHAHIAIGDKTSGDILFHVHQAHLFQQIHEAILREYPNIWKPIADLFSTIVS